MLHQCTFHMHEKLVPPYREILNQSLDYYFYNYGPLYGFHSQLGPAFDIVS